MYATLILAVLLLESPTGSQAATDPECITDKYRRYAEAQEDWQRSLTELMIDRAPEYAGVARQFMEDQLTAIERNLLTVEWLASNAPSELRTEGALNTWIRIGPETTERIERSSDRYRELARLQERVRTRPADPDGEQLRALMREEITLLPQYETLLDSLMQSVEEATAIECR